MRIKIAPSILAADFGFLTREIKKVERAGADLIHIDVMDGNFVPNITMGPVIVKYIRGATKLPLESHLMIKEPEKYITSFVRAGSKMITVHIEAISTLKIKKLSAKLKRQGIKLGVSLNPKTPLSKIKSMLKYVDFVLVMSVEPGFSGQKFMPSAIEKVRRLRAIFKGDIAVDGGVNDKVAAALIAAGANILVAASYIFNAKNTKVAIERLRYAK